MVRVILTCAALLVAGEGRGAWTHEFNVWQTGSVDEFLAADLSAGDRVSLSLGGRLFDVVGSFGDDTARVVGIVGNGGGYGTPEGGDVPIDISLSSDVAWRVLGEQRLGVLRDGDAEGLTGVPNDNPNTVDLQELNAVRNNFGLAPNDPNYLRGADVNYDDRVDISDLNTVRNYFGLTGYWEWIAPDGPFCQQNNWQECRPLRATPEPSTAAMLIIAAFAGSTRRARRRVR